MEIPTEMLVSVVQFRDISSLWENIHVDLRLKIMFTSELLKTRMLPIQVTCRILNLVVKIKYVVFRGKVIIRNIILQSEIVDLCN